MLSTKKNHKFRNQSILTPCAQIWPQIRAELYDWLLNKPKERVLEQGIVNPKSSPFGPFNRNTTTLIIEIGDFIPLRYLPSHNNDRLTRLTTTMRGLRNVQEENKWRAGRNGTQDSVREKIKRCLKKKVTLVPMMGTQNNTLQEG